MTFYIREASQCLLIFSVYPGLYRKDICLSGSGKVILDETIKRIRVTSLRFFFTIYDNVYYRKLWLFLNDQKCLFPPYCDPCTLILCTWPQTSLNTYNL